MPSPTSVNDLVAGLSPPQQSAINLVRLTLNCFNTRDGTGLLSGVERYNALAGRVELCAVQASDLPKFWALLLRRMQWPVPPKRSDPEVLACLAAPDPALVLRALATETASVVTLARMLHDADKQARRADEADDSPDAAPFNDALPGDAP